MEAIGGEFKEGSAPKDKLNCRRLCSAIAFPSLLLFPLPLPLPLFDVLFRFNSVLGSKVEKSNEVDFARLQDNRAR